MRFDHTRITIRERTYAEVLDLALVILRHSGRKVALAMLPLVIVMALLNHYLIGWMASWDYFAYESDFLPYRFVWNMGLLVFLELPLVSAAATLYLGQYVFHEFPSLRQAWRELGSLSVPTVIYLFIWRGPLVAILLLWNAETNATYSPQEFWLFVWCFLQFLIRTIRPFLNEIILLERHPMRAKTANQMTIRRRNMFFHSRKFSNIFGRSFNTAFIVILLAGAIAHGVLFLNGVFFNSWRWTPLLVNVAIPAAMWLAGILEAVVRFLDYLDVRIRDEGWEIDLRFRTEANRELQRMMGSTP
jgi:hypothetical protein